MRPIPLPGNGAPSVFLLESTRGNYAYFVADGDRGVLVDTGLPRNGPGIWDELKRGGHRLTDIVITHYDVDHIGGLAWLTERTDATVWLPAGDVPYILGEKPRPGVKRWMAALMPVSPPMRFVVLNAGEWVGPVEAVASPGHTPGHLAFRGPGFLMAGDALTVRAGRPVPSPGFLAWDRTLLRQTADTLVLGSTGWVLPSHGEPLLLPPPDSHGHQGTTTPRFTRRKG